MPRPRKVPGASPAGTDGGASPAPAEDGPTWLRSTPPADEPVGLDDGATSWFDLDPATWDHLAVDRQVAILASTPPATLEERLELQGWPTVDEVLADPAYVPDPPGQRYGEDRVDVPRDRRHHRDGLGRDDDADRPGERGPARGTSTAGALTIVTAAELLAEPSPAIAELVDGLLPATGIALLAGDPKSMKTLLGVQVSCAVGHPDVARFLGRPLRHGPVLFVEEEGGRHKLAERIAMQMRGYGLTSPPDLHFVLHQGVALDNPRSLRSLLDAARLVGPRIVVLDPFAFLHSRDENKPAEMAGLMRGLVPIAVELECLVVVIHHLTKPQADRKPSRLAQRIRGAGSLAGATDANIVLDRESDYGVRLRAEYRDAESLELHLELDPTTLLLAPADAPTDDAAGPARKVPMADVVAFATEHGQVGVRAVAERFEISRNTARGCLDDAVSAGFLDRATDARLGHLYFPSEIDR